MQASYKFFGLFQNVSYFFEVYNWKSGTVNISNFSKCMLRKQPS